MLGNEYDQVDRKPDESVLNLLQSDDLVTSEGTKIKISEKVNLSAYLSYLFLCKT